MRDNFILGIQPNKISIIVRPSSFKRAFGDRMNINGKPYTVYFQGTRNQCVDIANHATKKHNEVIKKEKRKMMVDEYLEAIMEGIEIYK